MKHISVIMELAILVTIPFLNSCMPIISYVFQRLNFFLRLLLSKGTPTEFSASISSRALLQNIAFKLNL